MLLIFYYNRAINVFLLRVIGIRYSPAVFIQERRSFRFEVLVDQSKFLESSTQCLTSFFHPLFLRASDSNFPFVSELVQRRKKLKKSQKDDDTKKRYLFLRSFLTKFAERRGCIPFASGGENFHQKVR
ncbi:MAG: hypothetical protein AMJ73_01495 [candidate division Zixibacteria bacterium SM1_73]|nr:MAG: hypothetical protein AMJ73_01495 [candidate division Zixibacteria bacterium SM1_73]